MPKLDVDTFISERLANASMYQLPEFKTYVRTIIDRAIIDCDDQLAVGNTTFENLNTQQQNEYNRIVGNLVWSEIRVPREGMDMWNATLAQIESIVPRTFLI